MLNKDKAARRKIKRGIAIGLFLFFCSFTTPALAAKPAAGTITPSSGTSLPGQGVAFTTTYIDRDGWKNIWYTHLLVNTSINGANCFYGYYNRNTNKLYLRNDTNTAWLGGYAPGSSYVIQNSYAKLNCAATRVFGSRATLTVKWSVAFKPTFQGDKNTYLYVKDLSKAYSGWVKKGTWAIRKILSISITPNYWNIGATEVNKVVTMAQANKITVSNNGNVKETLTLSLVNPSGWAASTAPGNERYVLSGLFCNLSDIPQAGYFNQDNLSEDIITTQVKKATATVFGYKQATANAVAMPPGQKRSLYLQFKSPTITQKTDEQNISVIISCQVP